LGVFAFFSHREKGSKVGTRQRDDARGKRQEKKANTRGKKKNPRKIRMFLVRIFFFKKTAHQKKGHAETCAFFLRFPRIFIFFLA